MECGFSVRKLRPRGYFSTARPVPTVHVVYSILACVLRCIYLLRQPPPAVPNTFWVLGGDGENEEHSVDRAGIHGAFSGGGRWIAGDVKTARTRREGVLEDDVLRVYASFAHVAVSCFCVEFDGS